METMYIRCNLAVLRALRRVTQQQLSDATGITQKALSALETGASQGIEFGTLAKLCQFFNCRTSDLLVIEEQPAPIETITDAELAKARELIARGKQIADSRGNRSPSEIWADFDSVQQRMIGTAEQKQKKKRERTGAS